MPIYTGKTWVTGYPYIYTNNKWKFVEAHIYKDSSWNSVKWDGDTVAKNQIVENDLLKLSQSADATQVDNELRIE